MTDIPSKQECFYILEMIESNLIDYSYTNPWADQIIEKLDIAPAWLGDIATNKYQDDQKKALREYVYSEPFETGPEGLEKFHVGCLWIRYERRELSWATLLDLIGRYLDTAGIDWECETPFHYLNMHEDAYFSKESEKQAKKAYLADDDIDLWIDMAKRKFEPFRKIRRANKTMH